MPHPTTTTPAELVSARYLAAETAAGAALALVQAPAIWATMHTMALLLEMQQEPAMTENRLEALCELIEGAMIEQQQMTSTLNLLDVLDRNARSWAEQAHPAARPGTARLQLVGRVS